MRSPRDRRIEATRGFRSWGALGGLHLDAGLLHLTRWPARQAGGNTTRTAHERIGAALRLSTTTESELREDRSDPGDHAISVKVMASAGAAKRSEPKKFKLA